MQSDTSARYRDSSLEVQEASPWHAQQPAEQLAGAEAYQDASANCAPTSGGATTAGAVEGLSDLQRADAGFDNHAHAALLKQRLRVTAGAESLPPCEGDAQAPLPREFPLVPSRPIQMRFHKAVCFGSDLEIRRLLLQAPFHVDDRDVFGRSALHIAAERGGVEPARRLLGGIPAGNGRFNLFSDCGVVPPSVVAAEVNIRTQFGLTPAHYAAAHGQVSVLELLRDHDADFGALTEFQATPLDLARAHNQVQAALYLHELGAYSAGPIWRPSQKFTDALSAWKRAWGELVGPEGLGGNDDFLSALFGSAHDGLAWPVTPGMKEELALFRCKWRSHAAQRGEFNQYESPVYLEGGHVTARWSLPAPLAHEMEALHQRWREDSLAGLLGVPSWWVQKTCEPHQPGQAHSSQSRVEVMPQALNASGIRRRRTS